MARFVPLITGVMDDASQMLVASSDPYSIALVFTKCMEEVITVWPKIVAFPAARAGTTQGQQQFRLPRIHVGSHCMTEAGLQERAQHDADLPDESISGVTGDAHSQVVHPAWSQVRAKLSLI